MLKTAQRVAMDEPHTARGSVSPALSVALFVLMALAALYAAWPIWRAFLPLEVDINEAWNAYHADAVRGGRPLYPDPAGLVINNYPPLSFNVLAALSAMGIDPVYAGRLLSLLSVFAIAGAIGILIRQFQGSTTAALVGAIWFCATEARFFSTYVGMNDPNLPALALMVWGLVWLVHRRARGRTPDPAILLMVVAGFYKHNLLAVPVSAFFWLALSDRSAAVRAALVGAGAAALGLAICFLFYGSAFIQSLLMARTYSFVVAVEGLGRLQWIAPALIIFIVWAFHQRRGPAVKFCALFVAIAFIFHFIQKLGAGVADNAQFELTVATAVGLGLAFENIRVIPAPRGWDADRQRIAVVLILIVRLLVSGKMAPYLLVASPEFRAELRERAAITQREIARIAAIPGPVICSVAMVCRWAGKPFLYDGFFVGQSIATGRRSQEDVDRLRQALGARHESVDPSTVAN